MGTKGPPFFAWKATRLVNGRCLLEAVQQACPLARGYGTEAHLIHVEQNPLLSFQAPPLSVKSTYSRLLLHANSALEQGLMMLWCFKFDNHVATPLTGDMIDMVPTSSCSERNGSWGLWRGPFLVTRFETTSQLSVQCTYRTFPARHVRHLLARAAAAIWQRYLRLGPGSRHEQLQSWILTEQPTCFKSVCPIGSNWFICLTSFLLFPDFNFHCQWDSLLVCSVILQPSKVNVQLVLNPLQLRWPSIASNLCQKGLEGPPAANTTIAAVYAPEFPQKSLVLIHPHVGFIPLLSTYTCTSPAFYTTNHYIPTVAGDLCFNLQELQQTGAPASELLWIR